MTVALGWWRHVALAGIVLGLLASPGLGPPHGWLPCLLAATALACFGRPWTHARGRFAAGAWLGCVLSIGALAGLGAGSLRLEAIGSGALGAEAGSEVTATGFVAGVPRRSFGEARIPLETADGGVLVVAREPVPDLAIGAEVEVAGALLEPESPFAVSQVERAGATLELRADRLVPTGGARRGFVGILDRIRGRAETALGEGASEEQATLARGFVLGQDDLIDPVTRESSAERGWRICSRSAART